MRFLHELMALQSGTTEITARVDHEYIDFMANGELVLTMNLPEFTEQALDLLGIATV